MSAGDYLSTSVLFEIVRTHFPVLV